MKVQIPDHIGSFWQHFLDGQVDPSDADSKFYESFQIGYDEQDAEEGLRLILAEEKTATSSLLWDYEASGKPIPKIGSLSVVEDGKRNPKCFIETVWIEIIPFREVDAVFAGEYGESDGTLDGWRKMIWRCYSKECEELNREMSEDAPIVCERFKVIYR